MNKKDKENCCWSFLFGENEIGITGIYNDIEFKTGVLDLSFDLKYYSTIRLFIILMKFHIKYTYKYIVKRIIAIKHQSWPLIYVDWHASQEL